MKFRLYLVSVVTSAKEAFWATIEKLSAFAERHGVADKAVDLAISKVEGVAKKEYAAVLKDIADAEATNFDTSVKQTLVEVRIMKETAEARLAVVRAAEAELELIHKLKEAGIIPKIDKNGVITLVPLIGDEYWKELITRKLLPEGNEP